METVSFVSLPRSVEGVQVTVQNMLEVAEWCGGEIRQQKLKDQNGVEEYIKIDTRRPLNKKQTQAFVGDWVLLWEGGYKIYTAAAMEKNFKISRNVFDDKVQYADFEHEIVDLNYTVDKEAAARQEAEAALRLMTNRLESETASKVMGRNVFDQNPEKHVLSEDCPCDPIVEPVSGVDKCTCAPDELCSAPDCKNAPASRSSCTCGPGSGCSDPNCKGTPAPASVDDIVAEIDQLVGEPSGPQSGHVFAKFLEED